MNALPLVFAASLAPASAGPTPVAGSDVSVENRLGERVPQDVQMVDHLGRPVLSGELFDGRRPVVLVPAYFRCPMLCGLAIEGAAEAMRSLELEPGIDFRVVTVSFDPRDRAPDAERARARAVDLYGGSIADDGWPFLTGEGAETERLLHALGFRFAWDDDTEQYAHGSAIFVASPDGKLTRVLYGLQYEPLDLRLALIEAGEGRVGSFAEQIVLTCYRYDPATRRYGFWVFGFLRIAGVVLLSILGLGLVVVVRRERQRMRELADSDPRTGDRR
jgi:protein SCO1/2